MSNYTYLVEEDCKILKIGIGIHLSATVVAYPYANFHRIDPLGDCRKKKLNGFKELLALYWYLSCFPYSSNYYKARDLQALTLFI